MSSTCTVALRVIAEQIPIIHTTTKIERRPGDTLYDLGVYFGLAADPPGDDWDIALWNHDDQTQTPTLVVTAAEIRHVAERPARTLRSRRPQHRPRVSGPVGRVITLTAAERVPLGSRILVTDNPADSNAPNAPGPLWPTVDPAAGRPAVVKQLRTTHRADSSAVDLVTSLGVVGGLSPYCGVRPAA